MQDNHPWYRISDLEKLSGVSRRTIHFYLDQGLLHKPTKTGKTMAYYDAAHLNKLDFIKNTKRQGLPLIAIKKQISDMESADVNAFKKPPTPFQSEQRRPILRNAGTRKATGTATRERILDTGSRLFREKGYKETKISDITKALMVGKGTFYFYFSDKKELLLECVPRIFSELFSEGWGRIHRVRDPLRRLELRAEAVLPVLKEFCAIIQLSKEAMEDADPKLQHLGKETYLSICRPLETDIKKGIDLGLFVPVDARVTASLMVGFMENLYYLKRVDTKLDPSTMWAGMQHLITSGISRRRG
jgi:AcrR family transcriptional regulator